MQHNEYKQNTIYSAFTRTAHTGILREIVVPIKLYLPLAIRKGKVEPFDANAIWDTGATNCVISHDLAQKMKLIATSFSTVHNAHETVVVPVYILDIYLPNDVKFLNWRVSEGQLRPGNVDFLIGMDIIARGDCSLTQQLGSNGKPSTVFSFRYPSTMVPKDFVKELTELEEENKRKEQNKLLRDTYNKSIRKKKKR